MKRDKRERVANFTIGHKVRTRIVAIDVWRADLNIGGLLVSRRMALGHCVRRETLHTYGERIEYPKHSVIAVIHRKTYDELQQVFLQQASFRSTK